MKVFYRRLGAMFYDTLLICAILLVATALLVLIRLGQALPTGNLFFQAYLLSFVMCFYIGFWMRGQTTGMAAWKLKIISIQPHISFKQALLRFFFAFLSISLGGFGLFWSLWDKEGLTLYDRLSHTKLVLDE